MELLERVGLAASFAKRYPGQLSGGQQQRVGVARALAADPPVMLMDEPFSRVDPVVREQLQDEFLRLQGELGKTIVFVTHDIDEAIKLGDQVAVLRVGGELAQLADPAYLLAHPVDDFVAGLRRAATAATARSASRDARTCRCQPEPTVAPRRHRRPRPGRERDGWLLVVDDDRQAARLGGAAPSRRPRRPRDRPPPRRHRRPRPRAPAQRVLDAALSSPSRRGVLVDDGGALRGTVRADEVLTAIEQTERPARRRRPTTGARRQAAP